MLTFANIIAIPPTDDDICGLSGASRDDGSQPDRANLLTDVYIPPAALDGRTRVTH